MSDFYLTEDISRIMPGRKDTVTVSVSGVRKQLQKQLMLCTLREAYSIFKEKHSNIKLGFSKFAEMRPKQCVLPGASGTHSVCVCTTHQNTKLMFNGSRLEVLSKDTSCPLSSAKDCISFFLCHVPLQYCFFGDCENCGDTEQLQLHLEQLFDENFIDEVSYKKWTNTDRSMLETVTEATEDFIVSFISLLKDYAKHSLLTTLQTSTYQDKKNGLQPGEVLVVCDFAENYSFVVQDEVQSFHWNNSMVTLHPFVAYFKTGEELKHTSFVSISECNVHDTASVHLFPKKFHEHLREEVGNVRKVLYFSDGCAGRKLAHII